MVNKKTDKVDAEKLAIFLKMQVMSGEELIKPVYVPEESIRIRITSYNVCYTKLLRVY